MTHITKLTEIVDGRLLPSDKKLSASLLEVDAGRLTISGDTLGFDAVGLATETFVTDAIAAAQLDGEVDLSGYVTKTELNTTLDPYATTEEVAYLLGVFEEGVPNLLEAKVDKVEGMGLSTNDFTNTHKDAVENIETSINTAIAAVVDGAPTTFDTLREIAEWIENDGVAATDLASAIAGKADRTELDEFRNEAEINTLIETYVMETYNPQLGSNITLLLDNKVDKVEGKGLSTNDFTDSYKDQLDNMTTTVDTQIDDKFNNVYGPDLQGGFDDINYKLGTKLDNPDAKHPDAFTTPIVNSIPLYTLGNNGAYVLCTPDVWLDINGWLVPGYRPETLGGTSNEV